jgi:hypothetical protein
MERLRRWMLGVLLLGLAGAEAELLLLEHYEDAWQFIPLVLIALAAPALLWHSRGGGAASRRALQILMTLYLAAGLAGVVLHFRGGAEFQRESDRSISQWNLVKKVMRMQAPPVLAPGMMVQLGLLGLAYAFSDSRNKRSDPS